METGLDIVADDAWMVGSCSRMMVGLYGVAADDGALIVDDIGVDGFLETVVTCTTVVARV